MRLENTLPSKLALAIADLNAWAEQNDLNLRIIVIGAAALFMHGLEPRATNDIDSLTEFDQRLLDVIAEIGSRQGLGPHWLNDQANGLNVPEGFESRLFNLSLGSRIIAQVPSRGDLIALKAAAFVIRGHEDPKDYLDLMGLAPTRREVDEAIAFVRKVHTPPHSRFFPDFEVMIGKLYDLVR